MKRYHLLYSGMALAVSLKACQTLCKQGDADAALLYLYLAAHEGMLDITQAAHDLHKTAEEVDIAIRNLAAAGAVDPSDIDPVSAEKQPEQNASAVPAVTVPEAYYTSTDISNATKGDNVFRWLVTETERCVGRTLRQHEAEKLMILYDNVRLNPEVIPLLVRHVAGDNPARKGLSFKKLLDEGRNWADRGVNTIESAERLIAMEKERESLFGRLLYAAGVSDRLPSQTERRYVNAWVEAGYTPELVERAYDITVIKTGGTQWNYTSAILAHWYAKGIRSIKDLDMIEKSRKRGYYHSKPSMSASDTATEKVDTSTEKNDTATQEIEYNRMWESLLKELAEEEKQKNE